MMSEYYKNCFSCHGCSGKPYFRNNHVFFCVILFAMFMFSSYTNASIEHPIGGSMHTYIGLFIGLSPTKYINPSSCSFTKVTMSTPNLVCGVSSLTLYLYFRFVSLILFLNHNIVFPS